MDRDRKKNQNRPNPAPCVGGVGHGWGTFGHISINNKNPENKPYIH